MLTHVVIVPNPTDGVWGSIFKVVKLIPRHCRQDISAHLSVQVLVPKLDNIIVIPLFYTFPIFTMYKISQILLKFECLESFHFYNYNGSTYDWIRSLEAELWRSRSCHVFVYLFSKAVVLSQFIELREVPHITG